MVEGGTDTPTATTSYVYDSNGSLVRVVYPAGDADVRIYDARGLVVGEQRIGADGTASALRTYTRDADVRVIDDFDGVNTHIRTQYDGAGRPVKVNTPRGLDVVVTYDAASRSVIVRLQDSSTVPPTVVKQIETAYADNGQVASKTVKLINGSDTTSWQSSTTQYFYDAAGRLTRVSDPLGHTVDSLYDDHGRLSSRLDMLGNQTILSYEQADNVSTRVENDALPDGTHEAGRQTSYVYDAQNRVTSVTDPLGHRSGLAYDEPGHLLSKLDSTGSLWSYGYDDRGRQVSMVDPLGNAVGGNPSQHTTRYAFDLDGMLTGLTDAEQSTTQYQYDTIERLVKTIYPDASSESKSWNGDGTVAAATDANGSVASFLYDVDDQPTEIDYARASGVLGVTKETFGYDKLGRMISATSDSGVGNATHTTTRTYDSLDRLVSETQDGQTIGYSYDLAGNETGETYPEGRSFKRSYDALICGSGN